MVKPTKRPLNKNIVDQWPEIFSEVDISAVPLPYLHSIIVTFKDGKQWNLVLKESDKKSSNGEIPESLYEFFENYEENIEHVDFRLDVEKLKKDVIRSTNKMLKRKK